MQLNEMLPAAPQHNTKISSHACCHPPAFQRRQQLVAAAVCRLMHASSRARASPAYVPCCAADRHTQHCSWRRADSRPAAALSKHLVARMRAVCGCPADKKEQAAAQDAGDLEYACHARPHLAAGRWVHGCGRTARRHGSSSEQVQRQARQLRLRATGAACCACARQLGCACAVLCSRSP